MPEELYEELKILTENLNKSLAESLA
jgi:hypothetical protein